MVRGNGQSNGVSDLRYVVCFYWEGERWQEKVTDYRKVTEDVSFQRHLRRVGPADRRLVALYVNNLYWGVRKWYNPPFKFVCFTNVELDVVPEVELRPFRMVTKRGVMPRMYMFSEEAGLFGHQVLSLDIDVVITGPLDDILGYEGLYCTRQSWQKGPEWGLLDGDIMSFRAGPENEQRFWKPLVSDVAEAERISQGRERVWVRHVTGGKADMWTTVTPSQIVSLKHHVRKRQELPSENIRIVSFHGYPRPHQFSAPWRKENWYTFKELEQKQELIHG